MLLIFCFFAIVFVISQNYYTIEQKEKYSIQTLALTNSGIITTQADWQAGTTNNINTTSNLGSAIINAYSGGKIDLNAIANADPASVVVTSNESEKLKSLDSDENTKWYGNITIAGPGSWDRWYINLGTSHTIVKIRALVNFSNLGGNISIEGICEGSNDAATFSQFGNLFSVSETKTWLECTGSKSYQYIGIKLNFLDAGPPAGSAEVNLYEYEGYDAGGSGTHTSASTQIGATGDAERYIVEYQGFDITETEPANTALDYRFQLVNSSGTSTNGWTGWATGDVASLIASYPDQLTITQAKKDAGETYLQVQSRLTSTDGVSTPTLSDYTVNYHTNKAPSAPTPQ